MIHVKIKNLIMGGLLTALAIILPIFPGSYFRVVIPPFTATLASHVPVMLAMFINPTLAVVTALGSAVGFGFATGNIVVAFRAAMHIFFGFAGAKMVEKGYPVYAIILVTMFIHGISEALIVLPFGFDLKSAGVIVGVGTMLHHIADSLISLAVYGSLVKARILKPTLMIKKQPAT